MLKHGLDRRYTASRFSQSGSQKVKSGYGHDFDPENGIKQVGGDEETYRELLADFVEGLPGKVSRLEKYMKDRDADGLSRAAHNIKGVASNLGGRQLSDHAGRLEKQASAGYTSQLESEIKQFREISDKFLLGASNFLAGKQSQTSSPW
jgi:two-component system sensor histidine kinase/response regulator